MCWTWSLCFYCYKYLAGVKNKSGKWVVIFPSYPSFRGGKWDGSSVGHFCLEIREIKHPFSFPTVKSDDEALVLLPVKRSRAIKQVYLKKTWAPKYFFQLSHICNCGLEGWFIALMCSYTVHRSMQGSGAFYFEFPNLGGSRWYCRYQDYPVLPWEWAKKSSW